jgi:hypothetical protein
VGAKLGAQDEEIGGYEGVCGDGRGEGGAIRGGDSCFVFHITDLSTISLSLTLAILSLARMLTTCLSDKHR